MSRAANDESANLDFLRAVAVLCVFLSHAVRLYGSDAHPLAYLGRSGVLMFFVHTSLVLMLSLERQIRHGSAATPARLTARDYGVFLVRRIFRIYPAAWVIVLLVFLTGIPIGHLAGGHLSRVPLDHLGLLSNLLLTQNVTGHSSIAVVLWSLPYEMQMYLILPFLLVLAWRLRWPAFLGFWFVLALACYEITYWGRPSWEMATYAPCFVAGVFSFCLRRRVEPRLPSLLWPASVLFLISIMASHNGDRVQWMVCLGLGTLVSLTRELPAWTRRVSEPIARYSYGIYLCHMIGLWLSNELSTRLWVQIAIAVLSTGALSVALYHWVEAPLIKVGKRATEIFGLRSRRAAVNLTPVR